MASMATMEAVKEEPPRWVEGGGYDSAGVDAGADLAAMRAELGGTTTADRVDALLSTTPANPGPMMRQTLANAFSAETGLLQTLRKPRVSSRLPSKRELAAPTNPALLAEYARGVLVAHGTERSHGSAAPSRARSS